jgi:hypothetical protein
VPVGAAGVHLSQGQAISKCTRRLFRTSLETSRDLHSIVVRDSGHCFGF